jgi:hypothetical protein
VHGKSPDVNRRVFLGLLGAGTLTAAVGAGQASATTPVHGTPGTLAQPAGTGLVHTSFPAEYVGVRWTAPNSAIRIRFADHTGKLGPWQHITGGCAGGCGDTVPATETHSALIPAGGARAYEIDPSARATSVAFNCAAGKARAPEGKLAGCVYLNRAAWGADESLRFDKTGAERFPPTYWPVQTVTVHHTATGNDDPDPAARMRAIYRYQTIDEDFGDIGYHFLIDEAGRVYEGRWSGTDGVPGFNKTGKMVNAAHVGGFNAGNVGIALIGTFTSRQPTSAARKSLTKLLAAICEWRSIDPLGRVNYVNPISGATRTVATIPGHRNWAATLCPGDLLAGALANIRQDVATLIDTGTAPPFPTPA